MRNSVGQSWSQVGRVNFRKNIEARKGLGLSYPFFLQVLLSYLQDLGHAWLKLYRVGIPGFLCGIYS